MGGRATFYTLFFIHLKTRCVHIAGCTPYPDAVWVKQQARNFSFALDDIDDKCRYVIHDRENSFAGFDFILKTEGIINYPKTSANPSQVFCKSSLGGLLNHYFKKTA
jgi:hypothetical protein